MIRFFSAETAENPWESFQTGTNLGSGRDNAPRVLDDGGLGVDAITYYKMMLDQEKEFAMILGRWDEAQKAAREAQEVAKTIDEALAAVG